MRTQTPISYFRLSRRSLVALSGAALLLTTTSGPRFLFAQELEPSAFLAADTVHDVSVEIDPTTFEAMIEVYRQSEDKEWISGTVTIDGTSYEQVGLRLKGNSSLRQLLGGEGPQGSVASGDVGPVALPWLIKLDEYVKDQNHDGMEQLVIRSNNSQTSMNEAVALNLLDMAGLASQQAAAVRFSVNGSDSWLRLAIENPKGKWMRAHFPEDGTLFKSEAEGDWSYRGDNYEDYYKIAFDLEAGGTGDDAADFVPLMEFMDFLNNADDETFLAELPARLDIESFATYLSMMGLIGNSDDIDGPGNNSYLYWNWETEQFTVVPWDMNLAFGGFQAMGQSAGDGQTPDGFPGDTGQQPPQGDMGRGERSNQGTPGMPDGNGGFGGGNNPLVSRFTANTDWAGLIDATTTELRGSLFVSGDATSILENWTTLLTEQATDLVTVETIESEAATIAAFFEG